MTINFNDAVQLTQSCKFVICHLNSKFDENTRNWTIDLPNFFTENRADYRQIIVSAFIYLRPDGTSDIGTTFHSSDLFENDYNQPELDYFIGLSGTGIGGTYTINNRSRKLSFWFKDYNSMDFKYGETEEYYDASTNEYKTGHVKFFIQCELIY